MNITDFYTDAPVLAIVLTLAYAAVVAAFVYILNPAGLSFGCIK